MEKRASNSRGWGGGGEGGGRERGRACKHLFKYLSPPTSRKTVSRVKNVMCALYEGFTHLLCLFDSVCEKPSVKITDHASWGTPD